MTRRGAAGADAVLFRSHVPFGTDLSLVTLLECNISAECVRGIHAYFCRVPAASRRENR